MTSTSFGKSWQVVGFIGLNACVATLSIGTIGMKIWIFGLAEFLNTYSLHFVHQVIQGFAAAAAVVLLGVGGERTLRGRPIVPVLAVVMISQVLVLGRLLVLVTLGPSSSATTQMGAAFAPIYLVASTAMLVSARRADP